MAKYADLIKLSVLCFLSHSIILLFVRGEGTPQYPSLLPVDSNQKWLNISSVIKISEEE